VADTTKAEPVTRSANVVFTTMVDPLTGRLGEFRIHGCRRRLTRWPRMQPWLWSTATIDPSTMSPHLNAASVDPDHRNHG
jgi:hypothetical protein